MSGPVVPRPLATSILTGLPSSSTEVQLAHVNGTLAPTAASTSSQLPPPHYPAHFMKGSVIQLANGELKRVEDLTTEDFIRSAEASSDLCLDSSIVVSLSPLSDRGTVMIEFSIGPQNLQTTVESTMEHPFFVYNRGWSSFNPLKTSQRYELRCMQLEVGDRCISLTQKNADLRHSTASSSNRTESKLASSSLSSKLTNAAGSETTRLGRARLASDSAFQFHGKS